MTKRDKLPILYQDDDIIVIEKPRGLAVQDGAHVSLTLISKLERQIKKSVFPIHRLDKETAGLILFTLHKDAARHYSQLMNQNQIQKEYQALCFGIPPEKTASIHLPIVTRGKQQKAHTDYTVLKTSSEHSFLQLKLHTGRMHQIRIHLAQLACPIIGDDKYGDFKKNKALHKIHHIKRLQLCALKMEIPINKRILTLEMPLPEHMHEALSALF